MVGTQNVLEGPSGHSPNILQVQQGHALQWQVRFSPDYAVEQEREFLLKGKHGFRVTVDRGREAYIGKHASGITQSKLITFARTKNTLETV
jgi:hypothetical protein